MISQSRLKEIYHYDGRDLIWRVNKGQRGRIGNIVGSVSSIDGYRKANIDGNTYYIHRLVWLYVHGEFPVYQIDHINGDRSDNRLENLRDVPQRENLRNMKLSKRNNSGVIGVDWHKLAKKWTARIRVDGRQINLGLFDDLELAAFVRKEAEHKYGFHINHGRLV